MSLPISNMGTKNVPTNYSGDIVVSGIKDKAIPVNEDQVRDIKSVDALTRAEMQGVKLSPGDEQFIRTIDKAIKAIEGPSTSFERSVHQKTNTIVVKVMNKSTGELIREIPPEKILDMVARFMEMNGMVVDEKV